MNPTDGEIVVDEDDGEELKGVLLELVVVLEDCIQCLNRTCATVDRMADRSDALRWEYEAAAARVAAMVAK